jgi:hypothetical protein
MHMAGIEEIIRQQLSAERINEISQSIGADPATTRQAVDAAVPMLMGGMANRAASPGGAETINKAATQQGGMLDDIGGMLGGAGGLGGVLGGMLGGAAGGGILGDLLGSKQADVEDGVTQASGLDRAKSGKLLMVLAPIVLAAIARHRSQSGSADTEVSTELQREADQHTSDPKIGGILGSILDKATGQDKRT